MKLETVTPISCAHAISARRFAARALSPSFYHRVDVHLRLNPHTLALSGQELRRGAKWSDGVSERLSRGGGHRKSILTSRSGTAALNVGWAIMCLSQYCSALRRDSAWSSFVLREIRRARFGGRDGRTDPGECELEERASTPSSPASPASRVDSPSKSRYLRPTLKVLMSGTQS